MTNWAESIISPQVLLDKIPPLPTTEQVSQVLVENGFLYSQTDITKITELKYTSWI
jgi:hypothetical protein